MQEERGRGRASRKGALQPLDEGFGVPDTILSRESTNDAGQRGIGLEDASESPFPQDDDPAFSTCDHIDGCGTTVEER